MTIFLVWGIFVLSFWLCAGIFKPPEDDGEIIEVFFYGLFWFLFIPFLASVTLGAWIKSIAIQLNGKEG